MATRKQLSDSHIGMNLPSKSVNQDKLLSRVIEHKVKPRLEADFAVSLIYSSETDPEHFYMNAHPDVQDIYRANKAKRGGSRRGKLKPDGGLLLIKLAQFEKPMPLICAEMKQQGSPDKPNQAKGNAVERVTRYIPYWQKIMAKLPIFPFVAFCSGIDFAEASSIRQRLYEFNDGMPLNEIQYWKNEDNLGGVSIFAQEEPYTENQLANACHSLAGNSLLYYWKRFGFA